MRGPALLASRATRASRAVLSSSSLMAASSSSSTASSPLARVAAPTSIRRGVASLERFFRTELVSGRAVVPVDSYAFIRDAEGRVVGSGPKETVKLPRAGMLSRVFSQKSDLTPVHFILVAPMRFMLTDVPVSTADDAHLSLVASVQVRVTHPQLAFEMASNVQSTFPALAARALSSAAASSPASALESAPNAEDPSAIPALAEAQEILTALLEPLGFACESFLVHGAAPQRDSAHAAAARLAHAHSALRARAHAQLELARARADGVASLLAGVQDPTLRDALSASPALAEFVFLGPRGSEASADEGALMKDLERGLAATSNTTSTAVAAASAGASAAAALGAEDLAEDPETRADRVSRELDRVGGSVSSAFYRRNEGGDSSGDVAKEGGFALSPDVTAAANTAATVPPSSSKA